MLRHHHFSIFLLLNLLVLHGYCMFNPMINRNHGNCVDVKAYFAVDNDEESTNDSSEDSDDFFHVENLEVTQNQKDQSSKSSEAQNTLIHNSLSQKNTNSQSALFENSESSNNQNTLIQNSQNQKNQNSQSALVQNSMSSQNQENQNLLIQNSLSQKNSNSQSALILNSQATQNQNLSIQNSLNQKNQNSLVNVAQSEVSISGGCPNVGNGNCEPGWKNFTRPSGEWCIKIFYEDSLTHSKAEERCQAQGATLSGLQNQMEAQYIFSTVTIGIYPGTGSIWVGLKRKKECENLGWTVNCTWDKAFEWTDKSATGTDGLAWACNQPDNARGRTQNCATLTASYAGNVLGFQTGLLDDVGCDFDYIKQNRKERNIRAYACGKKSRA